MAEPTQERPAIHVCLAGPSEPGLYRWVEVGAEEEGLPTRYVDLGVGEVVPAAHAAAQSSRFGIGVAIGQGRVVLHEAHMPPALPVLAFELGEDAPRVSRLMGSNAARLVVRLPLRFADEPEEIPDPVSPARRPRAAQAAPDNGAVDAGAVTHIAGIVARILRERGIL